VRIAADGSWVAIFGRGRDAWADRLWLGRPMGHSGLVYGRDRKLYLHSWRSIEALRSARERTFAELAHLAPYER
jgi:hypothetical protein